MTAGRLRDPRRESPDGVELRVTVLEVQFQEMGRRIDMHIETTNRLIERLDTRADRTDVMFGRLIGALIVIQALVILLAPAIRNAFGLAPS